jgi:hypothetical protein
MCEEDIWGLMGLYQRVKWGIITNRVICGMYVVVNYYAWDEVWSSRHKNMV